MHPYGKHTPADTDVAGVLNRCYTRGTKTRSRP
jgi:hypothetical protein